MGKVEDFMKTETFKRAEEIAKKSITEMVLMQDKADAYDLLVEPLTELIFKYKEDDSLGSYDKHLYEIIESILSDKETTQFTCGSCGAKWNLLNDPTAETDTCPECGVTVNSDSFRTEFTCGSCGEEWNVLNREPEKDRCPKCGKLVSRNKHSKRSTK